MHKTYYPCGVAVDPSSKDLYFAERVDGVEMDYDDDIELVMYNENLERIRNFEPSQELISMWKGQGKPVLGFDEQDFNVSIVQKCTGEIRSFLDSEAVSIDQLCADPWFKSRDYSHAFYLPGYREAEQRVI